MSSTQIRYSTVAPAVSSRIRGVSPLPTKLRDLLPETKGVAGEYGSDFCGRPSASLLWKFLAKRVGADGFFVVAAIRSTARAWVRTISIDHGSSRHAEARVLHQISGHLLWPTWQPLGTRRLRPATIHKPT